MIVSVNIVNPFNEYKCEEHNELLVSILLILPTNTNSNGVMNRCQYCLILTTNTNVG